MTYVKFNHAVINMVLNKFVLFKAFAALFEEKKNT